jgi:hypothetical protein
MKMGMPQSKSGYGNKEKNACPCQESNPRHPAHRMPSNNLAIPAHKQNIQYINTDTTSPQMYL